VKKRNVAKVLSVFIILVIVDYFFRSYFNHFIGAIKSQEQTAGTLRLYTAMYWSIIIILGMIITPFIDYLFNIISRSKKGKKLRKKAVYFFFYYFLFFADMITIFCLFLLKDQAMENSLYILLLVLGVIVLSILWFIITIGIGTRHSYLIKECIRVFNRKKGE